MCMCMCMCVCMCMCMCTCMCMCMSHVACRMCMVRMRMVRMPCACACMLGHPGTEGWLCPDCDADACAVCGGAGELLLCDDCPRAWHLHCSVPVLDAVPEGDWRSACALSAHPFSTPTLTPAPPLAAPPPLPEQMRRVPR
jgi:hypothetical protein